MRKTIEQAYEELRQIIDGGSESFTHDDAVQYLKDRFAQPEQQPDYAWPTVEDYENDAGFSVGDAFKMGWSMARTTNDLFTQMMEQP